jgi:3-hydroxyacyl-[acyl-carrier-protein] dehydratase
VDTREICKRIPHRPPFLWVDEVESISESQIKTRKNIPPDLELFKGHYPDYPILPGVLTCEAVFQAGALLISEIIGSENDFDGRVPVLTRITGARFKREVRPGDLLEVQVDLQETVGPAWFLKGKALVNGKVSVKVDFACTLAKPAPAIPE